MKLLIKILLPLLLIAGSVLFARYLISTRPEPQKREVTPVIPMVEFIEVTPQTHRPPVNSFGVVQTYDRASLTPEISARITWVADQFRVGNQIRQGTPLVKLERTDFVAQLEQRRAELADIQRNQAEEEVLAQQAKADWLASGRQLESASPFRLRQPQLAALNAQLAAAEAAISKAQLDLERTIINAPFDAIVLSREANLGELASPQSSIGSLASIDRAEIRIPLSTAQQRRLPDLTSAKGENSLTQSKPITLSLAETPAQTREGVLTRIDPQVDARNQVLYAIVEVEKPLNPAPFPLNFGSFVNVHLVGSELSNAFKLPESALVEDRFVWLIDDANQLRQLLVERHGASNGEVFCQLKPSQTQSEAVQSLTSAAPLRVITRPLTSFHPQMKVRPTMKNSPR